MNKISVIIPTLNEESTIGVLLHHILQNARTIPFEIIIVDGGSEDNTTKEAQKIIPNIHIVDSLKGRAIQMNKGAKFATGNILYFLHADSLPPNNFDSLIADKINSENFAGCFRMKFNSNHWWLKLAGWFTKFNWKACRGGDQSLFVTKDIFEELEGYNEGFTIYEDIEFINKLYTRKEFCVIQNCITTSSRRYEKNGVLRLQFHFWKIYFLRWRGATAKELQKYYLKHIA